MRPAIAAPALVALLAAAGCATVPDAPAQPTTRTVAAPAAEVRQRVAAATRDLGLTTQDATDTGALRATAVAGASDAWARCPRILISYDEDDGIPPRSSWAPPQARRAVADVTLTPAATGGGTDVRVSTRFTATYRDPYRNQPVAGACASTGELEARLLDAAAGGAAG